MQLAWMGIEIVAEYINCVWEEWWWSVFK